MYSIVDQPIDPTQFDVYAIASFTHNNIEITTAIIGQSHFFMCNIHNKIYSELLAGKNRSLPHAHTSIAQKDFSTTHIHSIEIPHYTNTTRFIEHTTTPPLNTPQETLPNNSISLSHIFPPSGDHPPGATHIYAHISGQNIASIKLKTIHEYPEQSYTVISDTHILYLG